MEIPEQYKDYKVLTVPECFEKMYLTFNLTVHKGSDSKWEQPEGHTQQTELKPEIAKWLSKNATGKVMFGPLGKLLFEKEQDYTWFAMKWKDDK